LRLRMYILKQSITYSVYYHFAASGSNNEKFGMVNLDNNTPWYPYHAYKIIGSNLRIGDSLIKSQSSSNDISSLSWIDQGKLNILLICKVNQTRTVSLSGLTGSLSFVKIDNSISSLQTGTYSSTQPLTINGYTVILLQT